MSTNHVHKKLGSYSFYGLSLVLLTMTLALGINYGDVVTGVLAFLSGDLRSVPDGSSESLKSIITHATAVVLIKLACAFIIILLVHKMLGKPSSFNVEEIDEMLRKGPVPIFLVVLLEELVARQLFLGLLPKVFTGPTNFYILMLVGNSLWALVHLTNFSKKKDRSVLRVLPQFTGGLFLSYLFVRYGFFVAFMAHYLYNVLLLSAQKRQEPKSSDWSLVGYYALLGLIGFILMNSSGLDLNALAPWFVANSSIAPIEGLSFWDYVVLFVVVDSIAEIIAAALLLDKPETTSANTNPFIAAIVLPITVFMVVGISLATSFFVESEVATAAIVAVVVSLLTKTRSGSSLARSFLTNMPTVFLIVVAYTTLGVWTAIGLSFVFYGIGYIPYVIRVNQTQDTLKLQLT